MCGICGAVSLDGRPLDLSEAALRGMTAMLVHRGPDQEGLHREPHAALGVRRLSVQDLTTGDQPIFNEDRSIAIVFNGEIFNFRELRARLQQRGHVFRTRSDTEVIVHLYEEHGTDCLQHLNGQFAFALWDARRQTLFLARDRTGEKPLYYTVSQGRLVFASEIKSLLVCPGVERAIDYRGLDQLFTFFMPVNPRTMFQGIHNLPPGRFLEVAGGEIRVVKYWEPRLPDLGPSSERNAEQESVERLRDLLEQSVRRRMIADVPVGAFVSGGLDSCVIAHLAQRQSTQPLHTFSIGHDSDYYDESRYSDLMARRLGSEHHKLVIQPRDIAALLPQLVWRVEAPSCKTSCAAYMHLYKLARQHVTVVLTGEGADEALGGYPNIRLMKVLEFCRRHPGLPAARRLIERVLPPGSTLNVMYHEPAPLPPAEEAAVVARFGCVPADLQRFRSQQALKQSLFSDRCLEALRDYDAEADVAETLVNRDLVHGRHFMQQAQYFEYLLKLPNYLLINPGDRAAMTHSVENRCPFLDHELIEFALGLPPKLRVRGLREKPLLRTAFARELPPEILRRSKQPFTTIYVSSLFRQQIAPDLFGQALSPAAVERAGLFRESAVRDMIRRLSDPQLTLPQQVKLETPFALVVTAQLWHQLFIEHFRPEGPPASRCN